MEEAHPGTEARRRLPNPRAIAVWTAVVVAMGLLQFFYHHLGVLVDRGTQPFLVPLICEMTGAFAGGVLFVFVLWLARRFPLGRSTWPRRLPLYLLALLTFAVVNTTIMWGLREVLFPLAGLGDYDYGIMPLRYFMELPMEVIAFSVMVGAIHAIDAFRRAREREVHAAMLQSGLAQAQLRNLRLQLQPHFLFNQSDKNYMRFIAHEGEYIRRGTLNALEARLDPDKFMRVNRSEIVRLDAVREFQPWFHGDYRVIMKDGRMLTWSRRYRARVRGDFA